MQELVDLPRLEEPVVSSAKVAQHLDPPRKSLAWMQLHMKEYFTLRAGRTYKPAPDLELDRQITAAEAIFTPPDAGS